MIHLTRLMAVGLYFWINVAYGYVYIVIYDVTTGIQVPLVNYAATNGGSMNCSNDVNNNYFHRLDLTSDAFRISS